MKLIVRVFLFAVYIPFTLRFGAFVCKVMEQTDIIFTGPCREWTRNLRSIRHFTYEPLKQYLITDTSGKQGKPTNAHKHMKYGYQLFKEKMVTKLQVKADILKGTERFFLVKWNVHASMKKVQYTVYVHFHQKHRKSVNCKLLLCIRTGWFMQACSCLILYQILDFIQLQGRIGSKLKLGGHRLSRHFFIQKGHPQVNSFSAKQRNSCMSLKI
jgi:hypothetical protein